MILSVQTNSRTEFVDVTAEVQEAVSASGMASGLCVLYVPHTTGAVTIPVFQTSTYVQPGVGQDLGYDYARVGNPTREALERSVAALEGGDHGISFSSTGRLIQASQAEPPQEVWIMPTGTFSFWCSSRPK